MVAPSPSALHRNPDHAVLHWLVVAACRQAARALDLVADLPTQPPAREWELARLTIGLADLVESLAEAQQALDPHADTATLERVTDLQARTWVAASLLEARARLAGGVDPEPERWAAMCEPLEAAYGASLFTAASSTHRVPSHT